MKTCLVTGGAGFLGSHLCQRLINEGNEVICIDNLSTGSIANIAHLLPLPQFKFIRHDIVQSLLVKSPISLVTKQIHEIYNLACPASPPAYQGINAIQTTKTCVLGALHVLELAQAHDATILQASTSEVYGDPLHHPQAETDRGNVNPIGIRACYDEGKRCAESLFFDHYRELGVKIKVIRIFNTYGPNMDANDGRVVSNFICQAILGHNITIYGDGKQTRSFCYVDDLINGIIAMMRSPRCFTGPVNLGNPNEFTILELAQKVIEKTGSKSRIAYRPLPSDDPTRRRPDITCAQQELHWSPTILLDEGLDKTIPYFQANIEAFRS